VKPIALIADDSLTVRMDLCETLADAGFETLQSSTVSDVFKRLSTNKVDVLILDVRFPDGDGVQLLNELRAAGHTLPVMMLSSEAAISDRIRAFKVSADEYIGKPYDGAHVVEGARRLIAKSGGAAATPEAALPTILIIDDSWTYREELSAAVTKAGYRPITAKDGEEGLRVLASHRPAAVLVDGVLPGIDGATVIRRIRLDAATHTLPCLLLTAKQEVDAELDALESGADGFVFKDGDIDLVLAKLNALLRTTTRGPENVNLVPLAVKRILTVDDSATFRHALAGFLEAEGYEVIQAESGEEAIDLLQVQSVDCVLLDLEMPGLGGRETCRLIKATPRLRSIPVVVLTGVDNRESLLDGLTVGADDFIQKSAEFEVLKARVRAQLRRRQIEEETRRVHEQLFVSELRINEAISARTLAETKAALVDQLERKNEELRRVALVKEALAEKYQAANTELEAAYRELQTTQAQLVQSAKLASLGELVAGIAHEINNPLAFAISHLTTARRCLTAVESDASWQPSSAMMPQWAKATARLDEMSLGLERIRDLILRLRTFSRIDEGERKVIDLRDNIESVLTILRHRCGSDISLTMECIDVPDLDCYPSLLNQAIMNLVANAIDAVEGEGKVSVRAYTEGSNCIIAVTDDGPGVPVELRERVLEPFFTTKPVGQGTGLGLSMTYAIVKKHRGELEISDVPEGGACVAIRLPTSFQEAQQ
jgi:two-component system, NtrC family, sensor kinase